MKKKQRDRRHLRDTKSRLQPCVFPPLTGKTYDVDFTAPRFDESGKKKTDAILTVKLNGRRAIERFGTSSTRAAPFKETNQPGPIYLQDHGNPVRFRNIWVIPRDADKEAKRPIVPGAERFNESMTVQGRLLISQLGCAACHNSSEQSVAPKKGPILDTVATRIRPDYLVDFIASPHAIENGSTMPDLFHGLSDQERRAKATQIASFLQGRAR